MGEQRLSRWQKLVPTDYADKVSLYSSVGMRLACEVSGHEKRGWASSTCGAAAPASVHPETGRLIDCCQMRREFVFLDQTAAQYPHRGVLWTGGCHRCRCDCLPQSGNWGWPLWFQFAGGIADSELSQTNCCSRQALNDLRGQCDRLVLQ